MARGTLRIAHGYLHSLFVGGVASSLTDGQLLGRFAERQDAASEAAFAVLLERHGPAVLRVCRAILGDEHHAEDAFQATFLVLVKKGGSLRVRDSLGPWLHRVACRAAARVKQDANRRRAHERYFAESLTRRAGAGEREGLASAVHEEIDRLPERYRSAVVLCDVEGCSYEEAARRLSCSVATVKGRLARGRERLRGRLTDHGLASSSPLWVSGLAIEAAPTVVSPVLARSAVKAALCVAARGTAASGAISAPVAALVKGVLATMALTKLKMGVVLISLICAVATATAFVHAQQDGGRRKQRMGPDRRDLTAHMVPNDGETRSSSGPVPSGLTFDEIRPTLEKLLKEKGSARVTTLDGIEVSVRLYDAKELARSRPLLEQVLMCGPVDIRGPADPEPVDDAGSRERKQSAARQVGRQLLALARRDIISGELDEAADKIALVRAMDVKWGLFDDTPDKVAAALRRARFR